MTNPLLSVKNLSVTFRMEEGEPFKAIKGISFEVPRNRTVALVGESGSGKSVTSMAILRLLPSNAEYGSYSEILFEGRDLLKENPHCLRKVRGGNIAMIFQEPMTGLGCDHPEADPQADSRPPEGPRHVGTLHHP